MKFFLILIILISSQAFAQSADGAMDCTVTGNVVVASEEGKFKTYSGIKGGVKANEKLILTYKVSNNSIYIELDPANDSHKLAKELLLSNNFIIVNSESGNREWTTVANFLFVKK